jgi:hypothetical protein
MSQPDPPVPHPVPLEAAPTAPAPAEMVASAPADGAPYRVLAPPVEPPEPVFYVPPAPRKPRPIIGPALSVFAVLLWAFVVFGQLTTSWLFGTPLGPKTATLLVFLTTIAALITSVRRSRVVAPPRNAWHLGWRGVGIAVLAFFLFLVTIVAATVVGNTSLHNHDMLIALVLVVLSTLAAFAGARLTSPAPPDRTHPQRVVLVLVWVAGVIVTLVAGADLATNG